MKDQTIPKFVLYHCIMYHFRYIQSGILYSEIYVLFILC